MKFRALIATLLLPTVVFAQGAPDIDTALPLGNQKYLSSRSANNQTENRLLRSDSSNNTELNAPASKSVEITVGGVVEQTLSNDSLVFSGATGTISATTSLALAINGTAEATLTNDTLTFSGAAASIVGGATSLTVGSAGSTIIKADNDAQRLFTFDASSDTALTLAYGDGGTTATQSLQIVASTSDGDDDSDIYLAGGGAAGTTRGADIRVSGNEGGLLGGIRLRTGDASGADIALNPTDSVIFTLAQDANRLINFASGADDTIVQTFGDGGTTAAQQYIIGASTSDADDDSCLFVQGGGGNAVGITRGADFRVCGNESGSPGQARIRAGNVASSDIILAFTDTVLIEDTAGNDFWTFTSTGEIQGDATNQQDIVLNRALMTVQYPVDTVAALGNSAGTAATIPSTFNTLTDCDGTKGVIFPATTAANRRGGLYSLANSAGGAACIIYPATGGTINGGASISLSTGEVAMCWLTTANNTWQCNYD